MVLMRRSPSRPPPRRAASRKAAGAAPSSPGAADAAAAAFHRHRPGHHAQPRQPPRTAADQAGAAPDRAGAGNAAYWLHGLHPVAAALANPARRLRRLLLTAEAEAALAARLSKPWRIAAERVEDRARFHTFLPEDAVHQGAALLAEPLAPAALARVVEGSTGPVLVLDQVTDPRNVGAILRSAAAFGAACVVLQERNTPAEGGALARAASGALELVPVVREVNLSRALIELKRDGFWVMGLAGEAPVTLAQAVAGLAGRRAALVLGSEGAGLRRLQRETCDELVRLPIVPEVESLNVASAAAVALYELVRT
jgi:23S rRNA (guanosine2251-2'-O)-methyltransferase